MSQQVNVYDVDGCTVLKTIEKPAVFGLELREDLVQRVHSLMSNNSRQPYAVSPEAGMQHSAESWGTGRAIARVPRVKGGGRNRAGQAAFANFCRQGRLAHPTKTYRKWHKKSSLNERRTAAAMAVAATQNQAIVEARGHRCTEVPMLPLVLSDKINFFEKTKEAVELLNRLGLSDELLRIPNLLERVMESSEIEDLSRERESLLFTITLISQPLRTLKVLNSWISTQLIFFSLHLVVDLENLSSGLSLLSAN